MATRKLSKAQKRELKLTELGRGTNVFRVSRVWNTYMTLLERGLVVSAASEWGPNWTLYTVTDAGRAALTQAAGGDNGE